MPNRSPIPQADPALLVWFDNFSTKFPALAVTLGSTAAEATATRNDYVWLAYVVQQAETFKTEYLERTEFKGLLRDGPLGAMPSPLPTVPASTPPSGLVPPVVLVLPGILPRLQNLVARLRVNPNLTAAIAQDLGLVSPPAAALPTKPTRISAEAQPNSVVALACTRYGHDAVLVETRRAGETAWTSLGMKMMSEFADARPPLVAGTPEVREYRFRFVDADVPNGDYSDVVKTTTVP